MNTTDSSMIVKGRYGSLAKTDLYSKMIHAHLQDRNNLKTLSLRTEPLFASDSSHAVPHKSQQVICDDRDTGNLNG